MREIKFRAWHKTQKASMYFELGELNDSMITKVNDGWYLDDCEIMQYTGLKDVNGVEIYEGDIVKWDAFPKGTVYTRVVKWNSEEAMFLPNNMKDDVEIIGNIYTRSINPDDPYKAPEQVSHE